MPSPRVRDLVLEPWLSFYKVLCSQPYPSLKGAQPNAVSFYPRQGLTQDASWGVQHPAAGVVHLVGLQWVPATQGKGRCAPAAPAVLPTVPGVATCAEILALALSGGAT